MIILLSFDRRVPFITKSHHHLISSLFLLLLPLLSFFVDWWYSDGLCARLLRLPDIPSGHSVASSFFVCSQPLATDLRGRFHGPCESIVRVSSITAPRPVLPSSFPPRLRVVVFSCVLLYTCVPLLHFTCPPLACTAASRFKLQRLIANGNKVKGSL